MRGGAEILILLCLPALPTASIHQRVTSLVDTPSSDHYLEARVSLTRLPDIQEAITNKKRMRMRDPKDGRRVGSRAEDLRVAFAEMLGISKAQVQLDDSDTAAQRGIAPSILDFSRIGFSFSTTFMVSLPDTFAAYKLQKRMNKGDYPHIFECNGYKLDGIRWLQLHGKPRMLTFVFVHMIVENDHANDFSDEAKQHLLQALEWDGNLLRGDIRVLGMVQSRAHLDVEFKIRAQTSESEEHIIFQLKSGKMKKDAITFLDSIGSPIKLLQIEFPSVGYHILREKKMATKRNHAGILVDFHCLVADSDKSHFINHDGNVELVYAAAAAANMPARRFGISNIDEQLTQLDITMTLRTKTSVETARMVGIINRGKFRLNQSEPLKRITASEIRCRDAAISTLQTAEGHQFSYSSHPVKLVAANATTDPQVETDELAPNRGPDSSSFLFFVLGICCVGLFCFCDGSPVWEHMLDYYIFCFMGGKNPRTRGSRTPLNSLVVDDDYKDCRGEDSQESHLLTPHLLTSMTREHSPNKHASKEMLVCAEICLSALLSLWCCSTGIFYQSARSPE
jgi:hypothetical protein